jgi:uncharacterized membrane protein YhiD involved in acid resistance
MWEAGIKLIEALGAYPWALVSIAFMLLVFMITRNTKFWDVITGLQHNSAMTTEVLGTVKRIEERQTTVITRLDTQEDNTRKLQDDVGFLTKEVEYLRNQSCSEASKCPNRSIAP